MNEFEKDMVTKIDNGEELSEAEAERIGGKNNMKEKLLEILKKYYDTDEYYSRYFYDQDNNVFKMDKDVQEFFDVNGITYKTEYVECFESCGYDCNVLSIAWIENGELLLHNVLLECM